ncbi:MAG TPA: periplasmic nitrate reductase, NapE protein [Burkholderiales bacterium]|nr:periplasmic nitrate reductase, NapE protein [Burkholderiales bacterium]
MRQRELTAAEARVDTGRDSVRKTEEFRSWVFLTFVMAPLLAVLVVSGYGFMVWMFQLFVGPPGN